MKHNIYESKVKNRLKIFIIWTALLWTPYSHAQSYSQSHETSEETREIASDEDTLTNDSLVIIEEIFIDEDKSAETSPRYSTLRLSLSETNDAAIMGLQESVTPNEYRPNDIGYTHGIKVEVENMDSSLFGAKGAFKVQFVSDLITEFQAPSGSSIFAIDKSDPQIQAIDIYRLGFSFEQHPGRSGLKFFYGTEFEYLTNTDQFGSSLSFLSGSSRQAAWHEYYNSVDYDYQPGATSRYSANLLAGIGMETGLGTSFIKLDSKVGVLAKASGSSQARSESKLVGDIRLSLNDPVKSDRYYLSRAGRFIASMGAKGEYGVGKKLEAYAALEKNFDFDAAQLEISFLANLPLINNFFDYSDFTTPRVYSESTPGLGGILDYEPVYTITLSLFW